MALYLEHFGLKDPPFRITPHPDVFFDGADRGATLEGLMYAILHDEGIVKVSGEIGSGKTTLCRVLMERLPAEVETVFLANPMYSRTEILHAIAEELGLPASTDPTASALRELQAKLLELYASGRRAVLMIDEAHAMPEETLEQVRLLSNLESSRHKLLQIVLFGQPELDESLAKPSMRQLKDRITHSFRTRPLIAEEVGKYISFRMRVAGYKGPEVFTPTAILAIARASSGLTRRINVLCDKGLLAAFAANTHAVTPREVRAAVADSDFTPIAGLRSGGNRTAAVVALIAFGAVAGAGIFYGLQHGLGTRAPEAVPAKPTPPVKTPPAKPAAVTAPAVAPVPATEPVTAPAVAPVPAAEAVPAPVLPPQPPQLLTAEQLRRFQGYGAADNALLRERLAATHERLMREPDEHHSIELFIAENSDPARTERFLLRARDLVPLSEINVIPLASGKSYRLWVTYGVYPSREAAAEAARQMPVKYQKAFRLEPRGLVALRASI